MGDLRPQQADAARRLVDRMSREEHVLLVLRHELYEGSWDEMEADLHARLEGRPYIFKLANRIVDDLDRIQRLREFERQHDVDLSDYVDVSP